MEVSLLVRLLASMLVLQCVVSGQSDSDVNAKWGVADSTATVGQLFRLHIPGDAFSGIVLSHTVTRSDGTPLPSWLEFDTKEALLQGIPTPADAGQLYLEVTAKGADSKASVTTTVFVRDVPSHTSGSPLRFKTSGPEFVWCKQTEPETVATLIVDADLEILPASQRLDLLQKFLSHMSLHEGMIKMVPVGDSPLHDSSALVSGNGDGLAPKTSGLFISWPVGCGQVKESHFSVLHKLDDDSSSGKMAAVLGHSVIGWHVTNSHFQVTPRKRRQVQATPTPALSPVMPTKTKTEATSDRMTHTLIDVQSPSFIQPTATQPPVTKTDEPIVPPPVPAGETSAKLMPTETTPAVTTTRETPPIIPTKTREPGVPTDVPPVVSVDCELGQKPKVKSPPVKLMYHVGDVIDYVVPEDTFEDCEVGGTRGLELVLYPDTGKDDLPEFLHFDSKQQKLVGLPMEADVKVHKFQLEAKKTESLFVRVELTLIVRDFRMKKKINHELSVTIDYDYKEFMGNVSERVHLANRIASVYGEPDTKRMVVTNIGQGSVIYQWTNTSLASSDCPVDDVRVLVRQLVNEDGSLTDHAIMKLKPFVLLSAQSQPAGACLGKEMFPEVVGQPKEAGTIPEMTTSEAAAKGAAGTGDEDDVWITTVVPAVVIVVILFIALLVACILYRKKRKGKMNVEEQNTFINKGAPVIFPYELEEKPSDVNKPLLVEGTQAPPPEYQRASSESPERPLAGNYRNLTATSAVDDSITEIPEQPYEPPPPVTASTNGKQTRPSHQQQQQPFTQPPQILP
ncbi:unnamed protein product [Candidula unifasciata]|uniref:Dystroglycan 1 n=1 Tax=Candidula unifasciata TaxID=100452 RepID=A0A8S3ZBJ7_9EUPU|nr:unnamed protein product [Candidula unifasciata]